MPQLSAVPAVQTLAQTTANAPVSGALATYYVAGTLTKVSIYADHLGATPLANPVTADVYGRFVSVFMAPGTLYDLAMTTSTGAALDGYPLEDQRAPAIASSNTAMDGTFGEAVTPGQQVYLSDGSGSKTAGLWYLGSATNLYSSLLPEVGIAPDGGASLAVGTIIKAGLVTGLTGLTIGLPCFISGTAGAITQTPPANARYLGQPDTTTSLVLNPSPAGMGVDNTICDGRLTLTTAVPVTTGDVTAATTIYWTPYKGNRVALYTSAGAWQLYPFSQLSIALGTDTTAKPYDVFAYVSAGVVAIERLVWTNTTTRATALTLQDGVLVKTGAVDRRYLGTYYTTATGQTEDSAANRCVWNYYNRVSRSFAVTDATASWAYNTATYRQARATGTNQVTAVIGVAEGLVDLILITLAASDGAGAVGVALSSGIGLDSTTTPSGSSGMTVTNQAANNGAVLQFMSRLNAFIAVGFHTFVWLEKGPGTGGAATSFFGGSMAGLTGSIQG